jgi:peptide deformylase
VADEERDLLSIVDCGDPVLRRRAERVDPPAIRSRDFQRLVARMHATMVAAPGVGLAAPQVGEPIQLAVIEDSADRLAGFDPAVLAARERTPLPFTVLVNPTCTPVDDDDLVSFYEGCLSVPGLTGSVARHRAVQVEALDEHGELVRRRYVGWPARIVQHEVDHLGGVLYLDRVETRSLSTDDNYARLWAGQLPEVPAAELGFRVATAGRPPLTR